MSDEPRKVDIKIIGFMITILILFICQIIQIEHLNKRINQLHINAINDVTQTVGRETFTNNKLLETQTIIIQLQDSVQKLSDQFLRHISEHPIQSQPYTLPNIPYYFPTNGWITNGIIIFTNIINYRGIVECSATTNYAGHK